MTKRWWTYFFLLLNLVLVGIGWWQGSANLWLDGWPSRLLALGRLAGLLTVLAVLGQILLIGRLTWVERAFGLDRLTRLHHWNGYVALGLLLTHFTLVVTSYALLGQLGWWAQLVKFLHHDDFLWAALGLALLVAVVGLSITVVRQRWRYESWYFAHLFTYLAIALAFGHQMEHGGDFIGRSWFVVYWSGLYLVVFGQLLWFRFLRPVWLWRRHQFRVDQVVTETPEVVSIYLTGRHLERFRYRAGQFAIWRFLQVGYWWQAHPFTISSYPNGHYLRLTVKGLGDFTKTLSRLRPGAAVLVDGPYGRFTADRTTRRNILLIAGGIGITPINVLANQFLQEGRAVILLYANRTIANLALRREVEALFARPPGRLHYVINHDPDWTGERGVINEEKLTRLVPDLADRAVYLCGPGPMMTNLRHTLRHLGVPAAQIFSERFSF